MNEEKLKEMAKPNKVGRAREFLQQGRKDEVYGDNEYYRKGFLDGGLYADEHPKNPWRDAKTDPPKESNKNTRYFVRDMWGVSRAASYDDMDKEWSDIYGDELLGITHWMTIPETPEGGEK